MKKAKAIELLKLAVPIKALTQQEYADFVEAVNMGMDALKQPTSPDTISRQAAIDAVEKNACHTQRIMDAVNNLPPVQPEPTDEQVKEYCKRRCLHVVTADFFESTKPQRLGYWIKHIDPFNGEQYECSECGVLWEFADGTPEDNEAYFCPKCGARMKGEPNEMQ